MIPFLLPNRLFFSNNKYTIILAANVTIISINDSTPKVIGLMALDNPRIKKTLKILEPTTFPIAMSTSPFLEATTDVTNSGSEVPIATTVKAITF